ncbi:MULTISPECIES: LytTR family DNA-binding domain-containing protein [unclassified Burkholderia]|uniref:LytR/AlgR family response regulator transcription factor n=1 Tax=unclassified Burkholderia TaxID=2613784 RepID=UPI000F584CEE|nr:MULTISPECIES: response regulator [unclassified Burkholderia]RQR70580.1 response regulator [Burkholderia sp. Bp9012]RQR77857.1 response regulator [Burkholderia sp. Bp9011]RQR87853.1 response regulator [Burkholderia sp. Bp9010]RQZ43793.1 response regulator [Burkholderia sp. Bp9099]
MRVLIVDDEALARSRLARLLRAVPDIEIIGEAADGATALALVEQSRPDVVFVDVQMPEIDGFDVAASLPDGGPALVFVTAFDQYALRAFDTHAVDYLLKPVEPERLARAVQRLRERGSSRSHGSVGVPDRLLVNDRGQTHVVPCAEIEWLEAADNYVGIHLATRSLLMRRTLAALLENLGPAFVRIHRGAAVALAAVHAVRFRGKGDAIVLLRGGAEVSCSRQYRAALVQALETTRDRSDSPHPTPASSQGDCDA